MRKETRCRHIGYYFRLAARDLLYASSHRQDNTYHGLCYTSRGALAGTRNSSLGPPWRIDPTTHHTMSERSYHGATSRSCYVSKIYLIQKVLWTYTVWQFDSSCGESEEILNKQNIVSSQICITLQAYKLLCYIQDVYTALKNKKTKQTTTTTNKPKKPQKTRTIGVTLIDNIIINVGKSPEYSIISSSSSFKWCPQHIR